MRPKLEKQAQEMQRLWQQLNDVFEQMQAGGGAPSAGSMLTTKGGPRCLVCYDPRAEVGKKRTIVGKDGHTYFQSPPPTERQPQQTMRPDGYTPPAESGSMITALMKPRMLGPGGMSSRKYMLMQDQLDGSLGSSGGRPSSRASSHLRGCSPSHIR